MSSPVGSTTLRFTRTIVYVTDDGSERIRGLRKKTTVLRQYLRGILLRYWVDVIVVVRASIRYYRTAVTIMVKHTQRCVCRLCVKPLRSDVVVQNWSRTLFFVVKNNFFFFAKLPFRVSGRIINVHGVHVRVILFHRGQKRRNFFTTRTLL